jgi:hypothetical protein
MIKKLFLSGIILATSLLPFASYASSTSNYSLLVFMVRKTMIERKNLASHISSEDTIFWSNRFCDRLRTESKDLIDITLDYHALVNNTNASSNIKKQMEQYITVVGYYSTLFVCPEYFKDYSN